MTGKRVVARSIKERDSKLKKQSENPLFDKINSKTVNAVLNKNKEIVEDGKFVSDAINYGISSFNPDLIFENLVKDFKLTKQIYGGSIIRKITGYNEDYLEKNIRIPEFKKILKEKISENIEKLKKDKLIDENEEITEKGIELASLILYTEELDNIIPRGISGGKLHKKSFIYGDKNEVKNYKKGDRYRDISIKKSAKLAIRRGHRKLDVGDLRVFERESKGQVHLVYGIDASGSMRGKKIEMCKKAGIALAYKAVSEKDKVGLIVFGSEIRTEILPTDDFRILLKEITKVRAKKQTNIRKTIEKAVEMFSEKDVTKHLILLTDALPTVGEEPEKETLKAVSKARNNKITISLIGIDLNEKGKKLAEKIVEIGNGRLYVVKDLEEIDKIVLEDYYSVI